MKRGRTERWAGKAAFACALPVGFALASMAAARAIRGGADPLAIAGLTADGALSWARVMRVRAEKCVR